MKSQLLMATRPWCRSRVGGCRNVSENIRRSLGGRPTGAARLFLHHSFQLERLESRQLLAANPVITEFMSTNQGTLDDGNGQSSDWIEIHNGGDAPVDLAGYRLTDDAAVPAKWTFPSVNVEPGGYLVVFASGQEGNGSVDPAGNLHTTFRIGADGEYLAMMAPHGSIVSQFGSSSADFPPQRTDTSYGISQTKVVLDSENDATYWVPLSDLGTRWTLADFDAAAHGFVAGKAALGYEDRPTDRANFTDAITTVVPSGAHAIFTRFEFQLADASAVSTLALGLKYDNGFIAYLNGVRVAEDNVAPVTEWFSTAASGSRRDTLALEFAPFDLTAHTNRLVDGKNVLAIHLLNNLSDNSDLLLVPELTIGTLDMMAAVGEEARVGYMVTPTPGKPNVGSDEIYAGFVGDTQISVAGGYHDQPLQVEIASDTPGATIYYTTDSSRPTATNGTAYSGPITISNTTVLRATAIVPDFIPGTIATKTYIFLDDILTQDGSGLPQTWGVQGGGCGNTTASAPARANYAMDRRVVNDRRYRDTIRDDLKAIPVLTLVLDPVDLWSVERGIYSNTMNEGIEWQRPGSVELFNTDGETEFDVQAGIRMSGGWGRCPSQNNKHSFRLLFTSDHGPTKLQYPWFGEEAAQEFDTIVLRSNFNHTWATGGDTATTFVNDAFASQSQLDMGYVASHGTWVHWYLNGLYWGLYNPIERPSAPFAASYFGGDRDEYDVNSISGITDGNNQAWNDLMRLVRAREVDYDAVQGMLDIDAFIDYLIIHQYGGDWDWPQNNWYASRRRVEGAKWYFHSWDSEGMLGRGLAENRVRDAGSDLGALYANLRDKVEEFRVRYADRIHKLLFNDGQLSPAAGIARLNRLTAPIDRAVVGESARWGDGRLNEVSPPRTRDDHWIPRLNDLRENYFPERGNRVVTQFRGVNLYPATDAPEFNVHCGPVQKGFALRIDNPGGKGTIYYTLDGTDPRLKGGGVAPQAIVFDGTPIPINADLRASARVLNDVDLNDVEWSALTEADFLVTGLRIAEINYHPHDANPVPGLGEAAVDNEQFEFVELANVSQESVTLNGARFTSGISFAFPDNTTLAAGQRILVVKDLDAFTSRYGTGRTIAGQFTGDLSDVGELIELRDGSGKSMGKVSYLVSDPWPDRANGRASSLELVDPFGSYLDPANWRSSSEYGGSPGREGIGSRPDVVINEIVGHGNSPQPDMLELYNATSAPVDIANWYIGNPDTGPFRFKVPASSTIPPLGYRTFSESELGFGFTIGPGDKVWLVQADASGRPLRIASEAQFGPSPAGISIGAWPDRESDWLPLAESTFGGQNTGPRVGDVIISEIQFDPTDLDGPTGQRADNFEFVELHNTTDHAVDLAGWQIDGDITLEFPAGTTMQPNQTLVLVPFNASTGGTATVFRFIYGMNPTDAVLGRYQRKLVNEGGTLRLERPADAAGQDTAGRFLFVDAVNYGTESPWPTGANATGSTLTRVSPEAFGNLPSSWTVLAASPGRVDFTAVRIPGDANQDGRFDQLDIVSVLQSGKYRTGQPAAWADGDWTGDGLFDQLDIVAALQGGRYLAAPQAARTGIADLSGGSSGVVDGPTDIEWALVDEVFALV